MNQAQIKYTKGICNAINKAEKKSSHLDKNVLKINGMSSEKVRHFMNGVGEIIDTYLEVGSYHGSTLCSVCNHNKVKAYAFENFSEFKDQQDKNDLEKNILAYCHGQATMIYEDFFQYQEMNKLPVFDCFFYDGIHTIISQYEALKVAYNQLADTFILIIDDWKCNISKPRLATMRAINELNLVCNLFVELPADDFEQNRDGYHCGIGIFILTKQGV